CRRRSRPASGNRALRSRPTARNPPREARTAAAPRGGSPEASPASPRAKARDPPCPAPRRRGSDRRASAPTRRRSRAPADARTNPPPEREEQRGLAHPPGPRPADARRVRVDLGGDGGTPLAARLADARVERDPAEHRHAELVREPLAAARAE